jgi:hypothetical protein
VAVVELTEPERLLWAAFPRGAWVDVRTGDAGSDDLASASSWGQDRVVRAEVIQSLLLGGGDTEPGHAPAVRLRGARVVGRLDLMGATTPYPLVCERCMFDEELRFVEASTKTVRIVESRLPALNGTRMRLDGILNMWRSEVAGVLRLDEARLTGQLCLREAVIGPAGGAEAVAASGLAVEGDAELAGLTARGSVVLDIASVSGSLDLSRARISCPGGRALVLDRAVIGRFDGRNSVVTGAVRMHNTRVDASLLLTGATLDNPAGTALDAGGLSVGGGLFLNDGFASAGQVRLVGSRLAANFTLSASVLSNPGAIALNLDRGAVGVVHGAGLACEGQFTFVGARVSQDIDLRGARLVSPAGQPALVGERASVDGALILSEADARGEIALRSIRVGQRVLLADAKLANPGQVALRLSRAHVAGDVFCGGMTCAGTVRASGAVIGGQLGLDDARISDARGAALEAADLDADELSLRFAEPPGGLVDLRHARVRLLRDSPARWPGSLSIDGLAYQVLEPRVPARDRLRWLALDPGGYQPQPYQQLASHYAAIGQPAQALTVMHESERIQRRAMTPFARAWSLLQDITVGYGYKPWRAMTWLVLLLVTGSLVFHFAPPPPFASGSAAVPHFNSVIYTIDLLLPVVDLGQKHAFDPAGAEQWLSYLLIAAGWVLVTTVAAGAARVLSRR